MLRASKFLGSIPICFKMTIFGYASPYSMDTAHSLTIAKQFGDARRPEGHICIFNRKSQGLSQWYSRWEVVSYFGVLDKLMYESSMRLIWEGMFFSSLDSSLSGIKREYCSNCCPLLIFFGGVKLRKICFKPFRE